MEIPQDKPQEQKSVTLPSLQIPREPQIFQFKIVGDILKEVYERLLGYRITMEKFLDPNTKQESQRLKKEKVFEPLVTEWGANRIITIIYQFLNEQTPFSHLSADTIIKMTNIFLKQLNADIYKNFEKYFLEEQRTNTMWRMLLTTVGFTTLEILSRGVEGRESLLYYNSQKIGYSGTIGPQPGAGQLQR